MAGAGLTRRQQAWYNRIMTRHVWYGDVHFLTTTSHPEASALAWSAYAFAKRHRGRKDVDMGRLLRVALLGESSECLYKYAMDVPGANVRRIQARLLELADRRWLEIFAMNVPGADAGSIRAHLAVADVLSA
jgi:hypothetical protein